MKQRWIFHIDINHCYAQIEEMKNPALRDVPMAVGGHEESRHGIILAKNDLAKKCGVLTGESLREAREACPDLVIIPPAYDDYVYYTGEVKKIYREYSDEVESFGLDEAWVDYTDSQKLFGDPLLTAQRIQQRVLEEMGLTVSVGISWNKAFAKLGSDMRKPYGMTLITPENYQQVVWPLPVEDLLYVGPATKRKLRERGILTIGELANYPSMYLKKYMGVAGETIRLFANGMDTSPVQEVSWRAPVKSVSNSMTLAHDVNSLEELRPVCYVMAEAIASRLREEGMECRKVGVMVRSAGLEWYGCECTLPEKTDVSEDIFAAAFNLTRHFYDFSIPLRSFGIAADSLKEAGTVRQLNLFVPDEERERNRTCDRVMDEIRSKYGFYAVRRACTLTDRGLCEFNVKDDHVVHPVGYFQGRKMLG